MSNLKSRLRLQRKAAESAGKVKEKKKETNIISTRNNKPQQAVQKSKIIEPVRNTFSRDTSINK